MTFFCNVPLAFQVSVPEAEFAPMLNCGMRSSSDHVTNRDVTRHGAAPALRVECDRALVR